MEKYSQRSKSARMELGQQGHIQFAFGRNDNSNLNLSRKQYQSGSQFSVKTTDRRTSNKSDDDDDEASDMEEHENDGKGSGIEEDRKDKGDVKDEVEEMFDAFDIFTQRPVELEASIRAAQAEEQKKADASENMFEDSFPEIVSTNISCHYSKIEDKPETLKPVTFSIQQHVERIDSQKSRQTHSTPLQDNSRSHRFTLKPEEYTSPVRRISAEEENKLDANVHEKSNRANEAINLSNDILAEFENDFESFRQQPLAEASINLKNFEEPVLVDSPGAKSISVKLSESDAAAMRAIADDSNFESEELFPVTETNRHEINEDEVREQKDSSQAPLVSPRHQSGMGNLLDGLDEEDFILTQAPEVNDSEENKAEVGVDEDETTFEESSSETETTGSTWTTTTEDGGSTMSGISSEEHVVESEIRLGDKRLVAKMALSIEQIPNEFFASSKMLGIGMKLIVQKRPSTTSLAKQGIGAKVLGKGSARKEMEDEGQEKQNTVALFNGVGTIWVVPFSHVNELAVSSKKRNLYGLFKKVKLHECALAIFKSKEKLKLLIRACGPQILNKFPPAEKIWDPRIAQWMLEFDEEDWNLSEETLVNEYLSPVEQSISRKGLNKEVVEAFFSWKVMESLKEKLQNKGLWDHFTKTEMPSVLPLMLMELNGFGLDTVQMTKLRHILQFKSAVLELRAFQLAGRQFSMASPKDVKNILFNEIGLKKPKAKGCGKDVLAKLMPDHDLPGVIMEWRKVNSALNNFVIRFQQERSLETGRVHGLYTHFTVTGRVTMHEPNLQCIPRDFDLSEFHYTPNDIKELKQSCRIKFGSKLTTLFQVIDNNLKVVDSSILNGTRQISMRTAFIPCSPEFLILTADYSQLELRVLAHLSRDEKLLKALNKDTDVFLEIASEWKKLPKHQITTSIRQEAKAIVYGVIYGMGSKALAGQMEIEEREAIRFMDQFMRTYSGVSGFLNEAKRLCKERGYIETISGRRRYLPLINSLKPHEKAKAERQAVNSEIQGSAADLVKIAMSKIHSVLSKKYPRSVPSLEWYKEEGARKSLFNHESSQNAGSNLTKGLENVIFMPILNLHDELIYEVRKTHLKEIAAVVKHEMESCLKLSVKLPVVLKTGESWGTLENYFS